MLPSSIKNESPKKVVLKKKKKAEGNLLVRRRKVVNFVYDILEGVRNFKLKNSYSSLK